MALVLVAQINCGVIGTGIERGRKIMPKMFKLILMCFVAFSLGCVEDGQSDQTQDPDPTNQGQGGPVVDGEIELNALVFEGRDPFGAFCRVAIAMDEVMENGT